MQLSPAQKSAQQTHLLKSARRTRCGIRFRRTRFLQKNVAASAEIATCEKCRKPKEPDANASRVRARK
ncbi:MAG TPA: hypothetical protein VEK08_12640 [Planctomycetota bacterium]|nr:hypothetical protein [Planctomycetota bacterium]